MNYYIEQVYKIAFSELEIFSRESGFESPYLYSTFKEEETKAALKVFSMSLMNV